MDQGHLFLKAIGENNRAEVERLIGTGISASTAIGNTYPLWVAIERDCPEMVSLLLSHGADVGRRSTSCTALLAVNPPKPNVLRTLLELGANPNGIGTPLLGSSREGMSPIHCATAQDSLSCVKLLVDAGAEVNRPPPALDIALRIKSTAMVTLIRESGGFRAIELRIALTAGKGDVETGRRLFAEARQCAPTLEGGAAAEATMRLRSLVSSEPGSYDVPRAVQLLLEGADATEMQDGASPISLAAAGERRGVLPVMLASLPRPSCELLCEAIVQRKSYSVAMILSAGVDLRGAKDQRSPLHCAARYGSFALVETLLELGLNAAELDSLGKTSLDAARERSPGVEKSDVCDLLSWHIFGEAFSGTVSSLAIDKASPTQTDNTKPPQPKIRDRKQLAKACRGALAGHRAWIVDSALDSAIVDAEAPTHDRGIAIGSSKFGGFPDLPPSVRWPRHGFHGRPLSFLAQINLKDVAEFCGGGILPTQGHLLFFYLADGKDGQPWEFETDPSLGYPTNPTGDDLAHAARVLWINDASLSVRTRPPRTLSPDDFFEARRIRFTRGLTLPPPPYNEIDLNAYGDLESDLRPPRENFEMHRVFGHPEMEQQGPRCTRNREYILLLQLGSRDGFCWGGGGLLYFQIHRDHLAANNFDRIFVEWEST